VRAIHVHHGLQHVADHWVEHCQQICDAIDIELEVVYVDASPRPGKRQSPEEAARLVRYRALYSKLECNECLLTAQHMDDQAETLLIQLMRTASSAGLAGMPAITKRSGYYHARPLLDFSRDEIETFAYENELDWVEDPSNQDTHFDRNYLRQEIIPLLEKRWPELNQQLVMVADMQAANLEVLNDMAATDMANVLFTPEYVTHASRYQTLSVLSLQALNRLSRARLINTLRFWVIDCLGKAGDPVSPSRNLLFELRDSLLSSRQDALPVVRFSSVEFRRYRDGLYLLKELRPAANKELVWQTERKLYTGHRCILMEKSSRHGQGLSPYVVGQALQVRYRKGGEKIRLPGREHRSSLKKLLNESSIPPWDRDDLPLFYQNDQLVAVADLWISADFQAHENEQGWQVSVRPIDIH
jgi:tRNA(Ile)-lysidine synthase